MKDVIIESIANCCDLVQINNGDLGSSQTNTLQVGSGSFGNYPSKNAEDGVQDELHNMKKINRNPKNAGSAQETVKNETGLVGGDSTPNTPEDGITANHKNLANNLGQNSSITNSGSAQEIVKNYNESWSIDAITNLMEDVDVSELFESYVGSTSVVSFVEFNDVIKTMYGNNNVVSESQFVDLIASDPKRNYYEQNDGTANYWFVELVETSDPTLNPIDNLKKVISAGGSGTAIPGKETKPEDMPNVDDDEECDECEITETGTSCVNLGPTKGPKKVNETHDLGLKGTAKTDDTGHYVDVDAAEIDAVGKNVGLLGDVDSVHKDADDGVTDDLGAADDLGQNDKINNKGGSWEEFKGGTKTMKENIASFSHQIKRHIKHESKSLRPGNYSLTYEIKVQGDKPTRFINLTESLLSFEELVQAYGLDACELKVNYHNGGKQIVESSVVKFNYVKSREPLLCENKIVFRNKNVANDFADQIAKIGTKCKIDNHAFGSSVSGRFNWNAATTAFNNIPAIAK